MTDSEANKKVNCPYYIVKSLEEFNAAVTKLGADRPDMDDAYLHDFPFKAGTEGRRLFTDPGTGPIAAFKDTDGTVYTYVLQTL